MLLLHENATVTIAHSKTQNLAELTRQADVLVAAVGRPKFVTADMVKPGAVVIDVGMDRDENGKLCGDVDFDGVSQVCGAITPVPGGEHADRCQTAKQPVILTKNSLINSQTYGGYV